MVNKIDKHNDQKDSAYQQRINEVKTSQTFWNKDRIIHPDLLKYLLAGIAIVLISACIWITCLIIINDPLITAIVLLIACSFVSIIMQPSISRKISKNFIRFKDATIKVDLLKNMTSFFYRDIKTGKLHEDILFTENNGILSACGTFKLDRLPIGISGEFEHFIRTIYGQHIPIFWRFIQAPLKEKEVIRSSNVSPDLRIWFARMNEDQRNNYILNHEGYGKQVYSLGLQAQKKSEPMQ